eukprot:g13669.t1
MTPDAKTPRPQLLAGDPVARMRRAAARQRVRRAGRQRRSRLVAALRRARRAAWALALVAGLLYVEWAVVRAGAEAPAILPIVILGDPSGRRISGEKIMPHPADIAVGGRMRELRIRRGLSQTELGHALGVSFQQVQKYEKGVNRMGASRLVQVARALGVAVPDLFVGVQADPQAAAAQALDVEAAKVARDFAAIPDPTVKATLAGVIRSLAQKDAGRKGPDQPKAAGADYPAAADVAGHLILSIEEAERLLAALPGAIEDARAGNRACGGGRVVSAPVAKRAGAGPTAFADGSMAVWRPDLGRWTVAAGADLAMNDPAVPCEAAEFCALRNAGGGRADGGGATPLAIIAQVLAALPNAVQADAAQMSEIDWAGVRARVRERLTAGGYSLTKACKAAGVDQGTMSKFLAEGSTKELSAAYLQRLAALFGRSLDWLLTGAEEPANGVRGESDALEGSPADPVAAAAGLAPGAWLPGRPAIPVDLIDASPLNYRKRFEEGAIAELADSLAAEAVPGAADGSESGVLQNLILRVHPDAPGRFEIAAGERRWRAVRLNIGRGRTPAEARVPARVGRFDDVKLLELALQENAKREDPSPMEEARGYAELRRLLQEAGGEATAREIATRVGLDVEGDKAMEAARRRVQLRLQLVDNLPEVAQAALEAGTISLAQARAFAEIGDDGFATSALEAIRDGRFYGWQTAEDIRRNYRNRLIPVSHAAFKTKPLEGEIVEFDGARYFADPAAFERRQREAAEAQVARLSKKWGGGASLWTTRADGHFSPYGYERTKDKALGAAVVVIDHDRRVVVYEGLVKRPRATAAPIAPASTDAGGAGAAPAKPVELLTSAALLHARRRKTAALQEAVATDQILAMRLAIHALACSYSRPLCRIRTDEIRADDSALARPVAETLTRFADRLNRAAGGDGAETAKLVDGLWEFPRRVDAGSRGGDEERRLWQAIEGLSKAEVGKLFAALIAAQTGSFSDYQPEFGDHPEVVALADTLGLKGREAERPGLRLRREDLANLRRPGLATIAAEFGLTPAPSVKIKDLTARIEEAAGLGPQTDLAAPAYVAPHCRFGAPAEIRQALAAPQLGALAAHRKQAAQARDRVEEQFGEIVCESLRIDAFGWADLIEDVCDDLAQSALIRALEAGFEITLSDADQEAARTFRALLERVEARIGEAAEARAAGPAPAQGAARHLAPGGERLDGRWPNRLEAFGEVVRKAVQVERFALDASILAACEAPELVDFLMKDLSAAYGLDPLDADAFPTMRALYEHVQANRPDRGLVDAALGGSTPDDAAHPADPSPIDVAAEEISIRTLHAQLEELREIVGPRQALGRTSGPAGGAAPPHEGLRQQLLLAQGRAADLNAENARLAQRVATLAGALTEILGEVDIASADPANAPFPRLLRRAGDRAAAALAADQEAAAGVCPLLAACSPEDLALELRARGCALIAIRPNGPLAALLADDNREAFEEGLLESAEAQLQALLEDAGADGASIALGRLSARDGIVDAPAGAAADAGEGEGDKGDSDFIELIELAAEHFPPGTLVEIKAPAVGGTPDGGPEAALADLVRALARAAARADHEAEETARSDRQSAASVEDQVRLCRQAAAREGWEIVQVFADYALSGAHAASRPGLQALLAAVEGGDAGDGRPADLVVAESIDRLARDQEDIAGLWKRCRFHGVEIRTVADGLVDELAIGFKGTLSALYLKDLAAKTHRGLAGVVASGRAAAAPAFGYRRRHALDAAGQPIAGLQEIDPEQAAIVVRIFEDYAAGVSPRAIAHALNAEGAPAPRADGWAQNTIQGNRARGTGILNNRLYVGERVWNRQRFVKDPATGKRVARLNPEREWVVELAPALAIVDRALWDRAKAIQDAAGGKRRPGKRPAPRPKHLLSGLIVCGLCGGTVSTINRDRYGCRTHKEKGTCRNDRMAPRAEIERRVLDALKDRLATPELVGEFVRAYHRERARLAADARRSAEADRKRFAEIERALARHLETIEAGLFSPAVKAKIEALEGERAALAARLESAAGDAGDVVAMHPDAPARYRAMIEDLQAALADADDRARAEARAAIHRLTDRVRFLPDDRYVSGSREAGGKVVLEIEGELAAFLQLALPHADDQDALSRSGVPAVIAGCGGRRMKPFEGLVPPRPATLARPGGDPRPHPDPATGAGSGPDLWSSRDATGDGGAGRDRTGDFLLAKQALSQLSYGPYMGPALHGPPREERAWPTRRPVGRSPWPGFPGWDPLPGPSGRDPLAGTPWEAVRPGAAGRAARRAPVGLRPRDRSRPRINRAGRRRRQQWWA